MSTLKIATKWGALDSTPIASGEAAHAHTLRTLAINANRLLSRGNVMGQLLFDSYGRTDAKGALQPAAVISFAMFGGWSELYWSPIMLPKNPARRFMEVQGFARVDGTNSCYLQIGTSVAPFRPNATASDPNVITLTGDGTTNWQAFSATDIPIGSGEWEPISLHYMGSPDSALIDTGVYGTPNTGTVNVIGSDIFGDSGTPAHWGPQFGDGSTYAAFVTSDGNPYLQPRQITGIYGSTDYALNIKPNFTQAELNLLQSNTVHYELRMLNRVRWCSIGFYEQDRLT